MKKIIIAGVAAFIIFGSGITTFAAQGWNRDDKGWWYEYEDGSWANNSWKWINGKRYYFNTNGYMLENTITPDGKTVNSDGVWTVDGVIQLDNYDSQYPLKGMLKEFHLELSDKESGPNSYHYQFAESAYYNTDTIWTAYNNSAQRGREKLSFYAALLSGEISMEKFKEQYVLFPEEGARYEATYQVMKEFLNSFDWRNESDLMKVQKAAELVCQASYVNTRSDLEHRPYGCLVKKESTCDGFAFSFAYLTRLMGMESAFVPDGNHAYNVVKIDGKWYIFDGTYTSKDRNTKNVLLHPVDILISDGVVKVGEWKPNDNVSDIISFMIK